MKKLKVMTILGTRPEIIRLSRVLNKLDEHCDHCLVHTGQNYDYELNQVFFDDLSVRRPDYFLDSADGSESPSETIANIIRLVDHLIARVLPDALLVLGDTNSCLAAIPAKRHKIPIFHMEAGNRCFDQRVPEEINRRIVDHTSDINLTYSAIAREYLLKENFPADRVIKTGSPMYEVLKANREKIDASDILDRLKLEKRKYFVVSAHREENIDSEKNFKKLLNVLDTLAVRFDMPIIVSTHPRTRKQVDQTGHEFNSKVRLLKPLGFFDYIKLQLSSRMVLSDSGTITEESSILGFSALNIRETHERPEGMEEASVVMTGLDKDRIMQTIKLIEMQNKEHAKKFRLVHDYNTPNVSDKVLRIIFSYTDYVNRVVWKKDI